MLYVRGAPLRGAPRYHTHMHQRTAQIYLSLMFVVLALLVLSFSLVLFGMTTPETSFEDAALVFIPTEEPDVSARSALVVDLGTGKELFSKDADTPRPIASVTKLLSSALFYASASTTETVTITWNDVASEGRSGRLRSGEVYSNYELLFPALLESSNDAASTMRRVAPVDLLAQMNAYAQQQQLSSTRFVDATGLSAQNISTAHELSRLGIALYRDYPHIFDITQLRQYLSGNNMWLNNNPFVAEEGYVGGKQGYTYEANRTAIAFFDEQFSSGAVRRLVYVLLGSDDLREDMRLLRAYVRTAVDYK